MMSFRMLQCLVLEGNYKQHIVSFNLEDLAGDGDRDRLFHLTAPTLFHCYFTMLMAVHGEAVGERRQKESVMLVVFHYDTQLQRKTGQTITELISCSLISVFDR